MNSDGFSLSIKEGELSQIAMEIMTISDNVMEKFSEINGKMTELKRYFDGPEYDRLINRYNAFKKNYSVVKNNIISYSDELICIINKVRTGDKNVALVIDELAQDVSKKAKNIEKL